jgi:hypothetical protein
MLLLFFIAPPIAGPFLQLRAQQEMEKSLHAIFPGT